MSYNSSFRIRFNHFGEEAIPNDGFAIDDILVQSVLLETEAGTITLLENVTAGGSGNVTLSAKGAVALGIWARLNLPKKETG